jgi:hypothetical protein
MTYSRLYIPYTLQPLSVSDWQHQPECSTMPCFMLHTAALEHSASYHRLCRSAEQVTKGQLCFTCDKESAQAHQHVIPLACVIIIRARIQLLGL